MSVTINRKLNLAIPVEVQPDVTYYVHSVPVAREVYERYYQVFARTFTDIYTKGFSVASGPRVALLMLRDVAKAMNQWDGDEGVQNGLLPEIRRLTNLVMPVNGRWSTVPFEDARSRSILDEDDVSEVENAVAFFTVASAMHRKQELGPVLKSMAGLWDAQLTYSNATDFAASLPTSTSDASTGERAAPSSIPS